MATASVKFPKLVVVNKRERRGSTQDRDCYVNGLNEQASLAGLTPFKDTDF